MKRTVRLFLTILIFLLCKNLSFAQTPQAINYQGVARDNSGNVIANQAVSLRLSILSGSATGIAVYVETHDLTTDGFGLFALKIGQGTVVTGNFDSISWGSSTYFYKVEIDPAGGDNYQLVGTNQFLSVPYALYAEHSGSSTLSPPTASVQAATNIQSFSAQLNGTVNGKGYLTTTSFLFGLTSNYGQIYQADNVTGNANVNISFTPSNLQSNTTYHYKIKAQNAVDITFSNDTSFTTAASAPILNTPNTTTILALSASTASQITNDGGSPVTARGVCWSTNHNPTIGDSHTTDGSGTGTFNSNLIGLTTNTLYYVRSYATNDVGTSYSYEVSFTTLNGIAGVIINYCIFDPCPPTTTVIPLLVIN